MRRISELSFGEIKNPDDNLIRVRDRGHELAGEFNFFHWELEMMDAFTDSRRGFDLIVGNPPWKRVKPLDDEFFTRYDPRYKSLKPKEKKRHKEVLLEDSTISKSYDNYKKPIRMRSSFFDMLDLQRKGDSDLWQIILHRGLNLLAKDGIISMVIPSQLFANSGCVGMRNRLFEKNILSLYVFENSKGIFPIHRSYRFALLTVRNQPSIDRFPAGFYLQKLSSLKGEAEAEKFGIMSKNDIRRISGKNLIIPEIVGPGLDILVRLSHCRLLKDGLGGWDIGFNDGIRWAKNLDLVRKSRKGWPVLEGEGIHQFIHNFKDVELAADPKKGLKHASRSRVYRKGHKEVHSYFQLLFRDVSGPTNMRTVISTIIPPHRFHINPLFKFVLSYNNSCVFDSLQKNIYNKKIAYLAGILNSMTFDFLVRTRIQMHVSTIIKSIRIPDPTDLDDKIIEMAARLSIGGDEFAEFAESLGVKNTKLNPDQRIETAARLDALVAHVYELTRDEYETVIESFDLQDDGQPMFEKGHKIDWGKDNMTMRRFFGKVAARALDYYDKISKERNNAK